MAAPEEWEADRHPPFLVEMYGDLIYDAPMEMVLRHREWARRRLATGQPHAAGEVVVAGIVEALRHQVDR